MEVATVIELARGYERGGNPVEDPSREGGLFVDEETLTLAAKMESVLDIFGRHRTKQEFFQDLLQVLDRASEEEDDPIEAIEVWLNAWLETSN
jgi:recombinational DNA repair protein (RecF pathway)